MIKDDIVKARKIDIDTVSGHVTLTGVVETATESRRAIEIARTTGDTVRVVDNLHVRK
jgi:osmotically-inducible protein OsmY